MTYIFCWGNNARRAALKGRACRIVASGGMGSALVEFESGERVLTSRRALRKTGKLDRPVNPIEERRLLAQGKA